MRLETEWYFSKCEYGLLYSLILNVKEALNWPKRTHFNIPLLLLQEGVTRAFVLMDLADHIATYQTWVKLLSRFL